MDDFGNIVYVLAAIGWFVWNTYRKAKEGKDKPKKARRSQPAPSEEKRPFKSLEDLIMDQLGETEKEESKPIPVPIPVKQPNQDKFLNTDLTHSHLKDDYVMSSGESQSHRVVRQVRKLETEDINTIGLMDELFPEGFGLKQAVIANAILERPYK